jgi:hypothetical protein
LPFAAGLAFSARLPFARLIGLSELVQRFGLAGDFVAGLLLLACQFGHRFGDVAIAADLLFAGRETRSGAFERSFDVFLRLRSAGRVARLGALGTLLGGVLALSQR